MTNATPAIVLLSGGLDSTTVAALALAEGYHVHALTVSYGQRHAAELAAARRVAAVLRIADHRLVDLDLRWIGGSALTAADLDVPMDRSRRDMEHDIPVTYVPARNTILLSLALAWAEVLGATDLFLGVNALDYSGYPDCRPEFVQAFEQMARLATRAAVSGRTPCVHAPLLHLRKHQIISLGVALGLDYGLTVSCYQATGEGLACGHCDACQLRRQGFLEAGVVDPTRYLG